MIYVIDSREVEKQGYTMAEFFYFLSIVADPSRTDYYKILSDKGNIIHTTEDERTLLLPLGRQKIDAILAGSLYNLEHAPSKEDRISILATELINLFPEGRKPGTNEYWRGSHAVIVTRLKSLISKRKVEFTNEEAIQAAKNYIESFNGDYRFMRVLKYFIFKNIKSEGETEFDSQLLSYIENLNSENATNNDWTSELK